MNTNIKKFTLSLLVVLGFVGYAAYQRFGFMLEDDDDKVRQLSLPVHTTTTQTQQNQNSVPGTKTQTSVGYKDGEFAGASVDAFYGNVQVSVIIKDGKITDVKFLDFPKDRQTSLEISNQAMPLLKTEAIAAQSANVDIISGATQTSEGFRRTLASALAKAKS